VAANAEQTAQAAVLDRFPSSRCVEEHQGYLRFELAQADCVPLSTAMARLDDITALIGAISAELRQASLQDIFLTTVEKDDSDDVVELLDDMNGVSQA
jgi:hypothetical protein